MAVEKEADVMRKEIKICLPLYKMAYAVFFTAILSIVRGVFYSYEIGIALEAPMALLAAAFCADTYTREITAKRWEIWRLYSMKNKLSAIFLRLELQEGFLMILSAAGYGMFFWFQKPRSLSLIKEEAGYEAQLFLMYMAAMAVTLYFWGILSHTLSCLFRNMWAGIGCCMVLWVATYSVWGNQTFGKWNLFSYTFRNVEDSGDLGWLWGKLLCVGLCIMMSLALPYGFEKAIKHGKAERMNRQGARRWCDNRYEWKGRKNEHFNQ